MRARPPPVEYSLIVRALNPSGPPKISKPRRRQLSVPHGVLDVAVPEVRLQGPRVVPLVGQRVSACVPKHVRVRLEPKLGLDACPLDHAGEPRSAEGCPALRREHKG